MHKNNKRPPKKKPEGWKQLSRPAYEEGGKSIGRMMLWHPEMEPKIWKWIGGTGIWPRWYLSAFRTHYIKDHQDDYFRWKDAQARARRKAKRKLEERRRTEEFIDAEFRVLGDSPDLPGRM